MRSYQELTAKERYSALKLATQNQKIFEPRFPYLKAGLNAYKTLGEYFLTENKRNRSENHAQMINEIVNSENQGVQYRDKNNFNTIKTEMEGVCLFFSEFNSIESYDAEYYQAWESVLDKFDKTPIPPKYYELTQKLNEVSFHLFGETNVSLIITFSRSEIPILIDQPIVVENALTYIFVLPIIDIYPSYNLLHTIMIMIEGLVVRLSYLNTCSNEIRKAYFSLLKENRNDINIFISKTKSNSELQNLIMTLECWDDCVTAMSMTWKICLNGKHKFILDHFIRPEPIEVKKPNLFEKLINTYIVNKHTKTSSKNDPLNSYERNGIMEFIVTNEASKIIETYSVLQPPYGEKENETYLKEIWGLTKYFSIFDSVSKVFIQTIKESEIIDSLNFWLREINGIRAVEKLWRSETFKQEVFKMEFKVAVTNFLQNLTSTHSFPPIKAELKMTDTFDIYFSPFNTSFKENRKSS